MVKDYTPCEAATWYCSCNLMHDYQLVATMLVILASNSSNHSIRVAKWRRSSRQESKQSAPMLWMLWSWFTCRVFLHPTLCRHGPGAERQHHCRKIRWQGSLSGAWANPCGNATDWGTLGADHVTSGQNLGLPIVNTGCNYLWGSTVLVSSEFRE